MHATTRRSSRLLALLALLAPLTACAPDADPTTADRGNAAQLVWREATGDRALLEDRVMLDLGLPDDPRDWHLDSPRAQLRNVSFEGETERQLSLVLDRTKAEENNRWDIGITGEFHPGDFNIVRIHLATEQGCRLQARLYREGERVFSSRGDSWCEMSLKGTTFDILMPELRFQARPMQDLQIIVRSKGSLAIRSIELIDRPLPDWLPAPEGGAQMVHLGPLARSAVGLWSGSALEADVTLDQPASLTFALGVPATLEHPSRESVKVHVKVTGENGTEVTETFEMPARGKDSSHWRDYSVALDELQGERGKVRLELEVPDSSGGIYAVAEPKLVKRASSPRMVILVTSDTHRYDHVGASGSGVEVSTPTLDALAARGVFFENCYTSTNVTNPSHVAIMTATHPRDTGILDNTSPLIGEALTMAESYRDAGWRTWGVLSAIHLGDRESGLGQGFDRMSIPNAAEYEAHEAVDTLLEWMPDADGAPLFVWLHLFDAHLPYGPPEPYDRKYYGSGDPYDTALPEDAIPVSELPPSLTGLRDPAYPDAQYRAEVDYLDSQLKRVIDMPRARDAIIVVTADHGENLGHHGIYYDHGNLYPDSIHVPLILVWPGAPAGTRVGDPVSQLDLGQTLMELSQVSAPDFPGVSILPLLDENVEVDPMPRYALGAHALSCSANYGRWHLILHLREHAPENFTQAHALHELELYDIQADPLCEHNVVDEYPDDARRMRGLLVRWLEDVSETGWASEGRKDPETMERLRTLGYTTADGSDVQLLDPGCDCEWCLRFR